MRLPQFSEMRFNPGFDKKMGIAIPQALFLRGCAVFVMLFLKFVLVKVMGAAHFGAYIFVLTWISMISVLAMGGWASSMIKFVPAYWAHESWDLLKGVLKKGVRSVIVNSLICMIALFLILELFATEMEPSSRAAFFAGIFLLPLLVLLSLIEAVYRASKNVFWSMIPQGVIKPILFLIGLFFIWMANVQLLPQQAMVLNGVVSLFALGFSYSFLLKKLPPQSKGVAGSIKDLPFWNEASRTFFFIAAMQIILSSSDLLMLGIFKNKTASGIYSVCTQLAGGTSVVLLAANVLLPPIISELNSKKKTQELQRLISHVMKAVFLASVAIACMLIIFGKAILNYFGPPFLSAYGPLIVLTAAHLVNVSTGPAQFMLTMTGRHQRAARIMFAVTLINLSLNFILIPQLGLMGAAMATGLSMVVLNIWSLTVVRKEVGVDPSILKRERTHETS